MTNLVYKNELKVGQFIQVIIPCVLVDETFTGIVTGFFNHAGVDYVNVDICHRELSVDLKTCRFMILAD